MLKMVNTGMSDRQEFGFMQDNNGNTTDITKGPIGVPCDGNHVDMTTPFTDLNYEWQLC